MIPVTGLVDCGSTGSCISRRFVEANDLNTQKVARPIPVYNADGTFNKSGPITDYVEMRMQVQDHSERILLAVADLGKADIFIGHDWLKVHNPTIDWQKGELCFTRCPPRCNYTPRLADLEADDDLVDDDTEYHPDEGDRILMVDFAEPVRLRAASTVSQKLAEEAHKQEKKKSFEQTVPACYHQFKDVFAKQAFDDLPERRPWDHAIELIPGAEPVDCKVYPLNLDEQKQLDAFLGGASVVRMD